MSYENFIPRNATDFLEEYSDLKAVPLPLVKKGLSLFNDYLDDLSEENLAVYDGNEEEQDTCVRRYIIIAVLMDSAFAKENAALITEMFRNSGCEDTLEDLVEEAKELAAKLSPLTAKQEKTFRAVQEVQSCVEATLNHYKGRNLKGAAKGVTALKTLLKKL